MVIYYQFVFVYIRRHYCCVDGPTCDITTHNRMHARKMRIVSSGGHCNNAVEPSASTRTVLAWTLMTVDGSECHMSTRLLVV
jgi:hypothetical protein